MRKIILSLLCVVAITLTSCSKEAKIVEYQGYTVQYDTTYTYKAKIEKDGTSVAHRSGIKLKVGDKVNTNGM